jgi:hypothetical protein
MDSLKSRRRTTSEPPYSRCSAGTPAAVSVGSSDAKPSPTLLSARRRVHRGLVVGGAVGLGLAARFSVPGRVFIVAQWKPSCRCLRVQCRGSVEREERGHCSLLSHPECPGQRPIGSLLRPVICTPAPCRSGGSLRQHRYIRRRCPPQRKPMRLARCAGPMIARMWPARVMRP